MNNYRYIVGFDLDGTLVLPSNPIPPELTTRIRMLVKLGAGVFFASGKSMTAIEQFALGIGVTPILIAAENGGHIRFGTFEKVTKPSTDLEAFRQDVRNVVLPPHELEPKVSIWSRKFGNAAHEAAEILSKFIATNRWDLSVIAHPDVDGGLDVIPSGISKRLLLQYVDVGCQIHYFGDSTNDIELMQDNRVIPYTVGNAKSEVIDLVRSRNGRLSDRVAGHGVLELLNTEFT